MTIFICKMVKMYVHMHAFIFYNIYAEIGSNSIYIHTHSHTLLISELFCSSIFHFLIFLKRHDDENTAIHKAIQHINYYNNGGIKKTGLHFVIIWIHLRSDSSQVKCRSRCLVVHFVVVVGEWNGWKCWQFHSLGVLGDAMWCTPWQR